MIVHPECNTSPTTAPATPRIPTGARSRCRDRDRPADYPFLHMPSAFAATPLDRTSLPQTSLDLVRTRCTNPLPWPGQFSPQLAAVLPGAYARPAWTILDPFGGSGTTLLEAARLEHCAYSSDLNPAAVVLARVYEMINLPTNERTRIVELLEGRIRAVTSP